MSRGRPTLLGKYDYDLITYIQGLRKAGGIINSQIVRSAAQGILIVRNKSLLYYFGGEISLEKSWAESFLKRLEFSKRKGTRPSRKNPADYDDVLENFQKRVHGNISQFNIPPSLVINWDQRGVCLVPVGKWTMAETGKKQIDIVTRLINVK